MSYVFPTVMGIAAIASWIFAYRLQDKIRTTLIVIGCLFTLFGVYILYNSAYNPPAGSVEYYIIHGEERADILTRCQLAPDWANKKEMRCDKAQEADKRANLENSYKEMNTFKQN